MSVQVIKAGVNDTIQDGGRFGYQHLGINPGGTMDLTAMKLANMLVGNPVSEAVIELCLPVSTFLFTSPALIALSGADFGASIHGKAIPINHLVRVPEGAELKFVRAKKGAYGYLAIHGGFAINTWLESKSTNQKAMIGGYEGRRLQKNDVLEVNKQFTSVKDVRIFPWSINVSDFYLPGNSIRCLAGPEFEWLTKSAKKIFREGQFSISNQSDRMGFRLHGKILTQSDKRELVSTAVVFGTVQLLPNGQLIVLTADHQTTGGYPRIANVLSADRSTLVQCKTNEKICFEIVSQEKAEALLRQQQQVLRRLEFACRYKINEVIHEIV